MPTEAVIRDAIARELELIEPGMSLVRTEFPLPNSEGSRGAVDIVAYDRYNQVVVIEIKRSNTTAREALHELHKYTELLMAELNVAPEDIRCILISTQWAELTRPFTSYVRNSAFNTLGLSAYVNDDATDIRLTPVAPLDDPVSVRLTTASEILLYSEEVNRDKAFQKISPLLDEIGCPSHIGIRLNRELPFPGFPFGLYLVLGTIMPEDPAVRVLDYLCDDVPDDSLEANGDVWEYRALCHLNSQSLGLAEDIEIGYPEKFRYLTSTQGKWQITAIERAGAFKAQRAILSDSVISEIVGGGTGLSVTFFRKRSSPRFTGAWKASTVDALNMLSGNDFWAQALRLWIDEFEAEQHLDDVLFHIYNPTNFLKPFAYAPPSQYMEYAPMLAVSIVKSETDEFCRGIQGELVWDGTITAESVIECVRDICGEPWMAATLPVDPSTDSELLARLKLRYALFEIYPDKTAIHDVYRHRRVVWVDFK